MLTIKKFVFNMVQENTYVVHDETGEGVLIDCGALFEEEQRELEQYVEANNIRLRHLIDTHGHFDHVFGNGFVRDKWGLLPMMHPDDKSVYENSKRTAGLLMRINVNIEITPISRELNEGDVVEFGNHKFSVIHTPGHSPGGVCLYCPEESTLFSGDSLFMHEIGRTDLEGGDYEALINGLKEKILPLPGHTKVYPGHGPSTTIADEAIHNPYLR